MRPSVVCTWSVRLRKVDRYEDAIAEALEVAVVGGSMVVCSVGVGSRVVVPVFKMLISRWTKVGSSRDAEVRGLSVPFPHITDDSGLLSPFIAFPLAKSFCWFILYRAMKLGLIPTRSIALISEYCNGKRAMRLPRIDQCPTHKSLCEGS